MMHELVPGQASTEGKGEYFLRKDRISKGDADEHPG